MRGGDGDECDILVALGPGEVYPSVPAGSWWAARAGAGDRRGSAGRQPTARRLGCNGREPRRGRLRGGCEGPYLWGGGCGSRGQWWPRRHGAVAVASLTRNRIYAACAPTSACRPCMSRTPAAQAAPCGSALSPRGARDAGRSRSWPLPAPHSPPRRVALTPRGRRVAPRKGGVCAHAPQRDAWRRVALRLRPALRPCRGPLRQATVGPPRSSRPSGAAPRVRAAGEEGGEGRKGRIRRGGGRGGSGEASAGCGAAHVTAGRRWAGYRGSLRAWPRARDGVSG